MMLNDLLFNRLKQVRAALPPGQPAYLVGGAVRDALLGLSTHDLDFVLPKGGMENARRVADAFHAAYYPLDEGRDTGRVVLKESGSGRRLCLDFSVLRGPDLESDLQGRDFTFNAMALDIRSPEVLIDPLGGAADLRAKELRACSLTSFDDDPLRILRGVRLASSFHFKLLPETRQAMKAAAKLLPRISPERLRDELFKLLAGPQPATSLRVLDRLGALLYVLPELDSLKGVAQPPPHVQDVWMHTLSVVQKLEGLLDLLSPTPDPDASASLAMGLAVMRLGRYRERLAQHFNQELNADRPLRPLLFLAALYHDIGKPLTGRVDASGRLRFLDHERVGADMAHARARRLHLSSPECDRLQRVVLNHMRPLLLAQTGALPSRKAPSGRAIYRFFRDCGPAGIDVCLLSLADALGTYEAALPQETWSHHLEVVRALMEAWWERPAESVSPPALVDGHALMDALDLEPGPQVGRLLDAIREAQAGGQISTREQALELARSLL